MQRPPPSRRFVTIFAIVAVIAIVAILTDFWRRGQTARQHFPIASAPELPYPTCPAPGAAETPELIGERGMQSGPDETLGQIYDSYRLERRGCLYALSERRMWPLQIAKIEALYDENLRPVRLWRRYMDPRSNHPARDADIKAYDFRPLELTVKHRGGAGAVDFELLRGKKGARPVALIGQGRGLLTMWIRRAKLAVGAKVREPALDFRGIEIIRDVTLRRDDDRYDEGLKRVVRVYSIYGRETVFADENDMVIGDLEGLVPDAVAPPTTPPALPPIDPPDPRTTP